MFQCRSYLDPSEVFKGEVEETVVKVRMVVNNLKAFKNVYEKYRSKITSYSYQGDQAKDWEFAPVLVFHRYDKFVERVQLVYVRAIAVKCSTDLHKGCHTRNIFQWINYKVYHVIILYFNVLLLIVFYYVLCI